MDPQQLQQLESLCEVLYNSGNEQQRQEAQAQLLSLQSSADFIPQCQHILDRSQSKFHRACVCLYGPHADGVCAYDLYLTLRDMSLNWHCIHLTPSTASTLHHLSGPYALFVAATALTKIAQQFWNSFTPTQRVELRNYVLSYLANKGPNVPDFVATALIQLVCRITKLGWFDDTAHREQLVEEVCSWGAYVCLVGVEERG